MAHKNRRLSIALRFAATMLLMWNLQLSASTVTWTGAGPNNNWTTVADWTCGGGACTGPMSTALSGADVVFPNNAVGPALGPVDTISGLALDSLTIAGSEYTVFTINNGATLTISNTGMNSSFDLAGSGTGSIVSNSGSISVTGGTLTNMSEIDINNGGGALTLSGTAVLTNTGGVINNAFGNGTFTIGLTATVQNGTLEGVVTNNGTITSTGANSVTFSTAHVDGGLLAGTMTTTPTLNVFGATTAVTNTGTLTAGPGGIVNWIGGTNSGTLSAGSGVLNVSGTVANAGGTINGGIGGATVTATVNGGTITGAIAGSGGTFNNVLFTGATLTNGTITGASNTATGTNNFAGTITNTGTLAINSGVSTVTGSIGGSGAVDVSGGTLNIASGGVIDAGGILNETAGVVTLSGTLADATVNLLGGTFDGTGAFDGGNVTNDIDLDVNGSAGAWGGSATLGDYDLGSYTQEAGGTLSINFSPTGNDELIDGSTTLTGALDLINQN
jgi:fibronectin-binding autotransporter adhesin